jgi:hypothetical protein
MKRPAQRNGHHCKQFFRPAPRNCHHQRYCAKAACRQQSTAEAQRRWLKKPETQGHFRGPENRQRVQAWRKAHPGYWRKGKPQANRALQELCKHQWPENERLTKEIAPSALQDRLRMQPALVVGPISMGQELPAAWPGATSDFHAVARQGPSRPVPVDPHGSRSLILSCTYST